MFQLKKSCVQKYFNQKFLCGFQIVTVVTSNLKLTVYGMYMTLWLNWEILSSVYYYSMSVKTKLVTFGITLGNNYIKKCTILAKSVLIFIVIF